MDETTLLMRFSGCDTLNSTMTLKEAEEQSGLSYEQWEDLSDEFLSGGRGTLEGFRKAMDLSESVENAFEDEFKARNQPRRPTPDTPVLIPDTSPTRYISFQFALNIRFPWEFSGAGHFEEMFFGYRTPRYADVAGTGTAVDTTPTLGSKGVRDMAELLGKYKVKPYSGPVYVANHYRAIVDLALQELQEGERPVFATARRINDWIRTREDMETLREEYLNPIRPQLGKAEKQAFDKWIPSIVSFILPGYEDDPEYQDWYNPEFQHLLFPPGSTGACGSSRSE